MLATHKLDNGAFIVADGTRLVAIAKLEGCDGKIGGGYCVTRPRDWTGRYVLHSPEDGLIGIVTSPAEALLMTDRHLACITDR